MLVYVVYVWRAGAAFFCLEPESTHFGRSRSRLRDLGHPEPPQKVAAPQHWILYRTRQITKFVKPYLKIVLEH